MITRSAEAAFMAGWRAAEKAPMPLAGRAKDEHINEEFAKWWATADPWPEDAVECANCDERAMVQLEGDMTCLQCGWSRSGD